jgi:hypothetical protein
MTGLFATLRFVVCALALAFWVVVSVPAGAQQPSSVNPTAS